MRNDPTLPLLPSQQVIMLKTKNLNKLLSQNTSPHVTSAIIFTPSGSLIASSHAPSSPKTLRTQTTLAANIWCAYAATPLTPTPPTSSTSSAPTNDQEPPVTITSLTLELSTSNLHITQIRPRLLLCLIGPSTSPAPPQQAQTPPQPPPRPSSDSATSAEGDGENAAVGGCSNEPPTANSSGGEIPSSDSLSRDSSLMAIQEAEAAAHQSGALGILRTQGEGLARWLEGELEGFSMPETM